MKASGIISALIFAHAAFAQASDASSTSVSSSGTSTSHSGSGSTKTRSSTSAAAATESNKATGTGSSLPIAETQTSSSGNPLIPSSASSTCSTWLEQFNTDTTVSSCFTPLLNALSAFDPASGTGSASAVSKALASLCAVNTCSAATMRTKLTDFNNACSDEISSNDVIKKNYDVLYSLIPFKAAVCAKDTDTQAYCARNIGSSSSSVGNTTQNIATPVTSTRRKRAQTVLVPNTDTFRNNNLMYLFTSPDMNAGELCTSCTQQILSKYVAFESSTPHALGVTNSPLLGGQSALWAAMQEKCPASFLAEVTNIAGVASADDISAASPTLSRGSLFTALAGAFAAVLAMI